MISPLFFLLIIFVIMKMNDIIKNIFWFYGKKDDYKDSIEYLKIINFVMKEKYAKAVKTSIIKHLMFRIHLKNDVLS